MYKEASSIQKHQVKSYLSLCVKPPLTQNYHMRQKAPREEPGSSHVERFEPESREIVCTTQILEPLKMLQLQTMQSL